MNSRSANDTSLPTTHLCTAVIETEILMVIRAATSIQRLWRGFRFYRTAVRYMQEMRQSATLIQAWWRGVLVRKNMDPERRAACRRAERVSSVHVFVCVCGLEES